MINFKNKNILITGASGGIGNELVKKFISLEGNVIGSGTKSEKLELIKSKKVKKTSPKTSQKNSLTVAINMTIRLLMCCFVVPPVKY